MKVLLAHNYYRSNAPSGEDQVFHNERLLLEHNGIEVITFERFNDKIDDSTFPQRLKLAGETAWSRPTYKALSKLILENRPDVAHFHNTFPLISPSGYWACRENNVPVVQTIHNFRLICPGAFLLRDGQPCEDCVGTTLIPALRHRCYRQSLQATGTLAWMLIRNRWNGTYKTLVNRYIALTDFAASRLIAGGLPRDRVVVKPNFIGTVPAPGTGDGGYAVYVGRLSEEKGLRTLLAAWRFGPRLPLKILGDGPLRQELELVVANENLRVEFLGYCNRSTIAEVVGHAAFQIVPSEWYEGFPMVIIEAYAIGTPVIASRIGSLNEIVEEGITGLKFEPGRPEDLFNKVNELSTDGALLTRLRQTVRARFELQFSQERNYQTLMAIYQEAITNHLERRATR